MQEHITSVFNGKTYGTRNGKFSAHLKENGFTYQQYFEKYISRTPSPQCPYCEKPRVFQQKTDSYRDTCGTKVCANKAVKAAHLLRTKEDVEKSNEKRKQTVLKEYGVDTINKVESVKAKMRESEQKIKESGLTSKQEQQLASKATKKEKYGDEFYNNASQIKLTKGAHSEEKKKDILNKRISSSLDKYGVENVLLLPSVREKALPANSKLKEFIFPSGRVIKIQGYESLALSKLLEQFDENDLIVSDASKISSCGAPILHYINYNRSHGKYYPDIVIKSENKIIEVKSQWWYDGNGDEKYKGRLENNRRKRQAAIDAGYVFEFWVFDSKGNLEVIK